jgi:unsaturated rhamnogalacturonyl hydrolase
MEAAMEKAGSANFARGKTVLLDDYFNHELKKDDNSREITWHYKWDEMSNGGFYLWGDVFTRLGAATATLSSAPTAGNLARANIYIIVDPDTDKETPKPNFISAADIKAIAAWVKKGGVLVLMANDTGNCEFTHLNELAKIFGIRFNEDRLNPVQGTQCEQGKILVTSPNPVFATAKTLYLKEISSLSLSKPAVPLLSHKEKIVMATAKFGKGTVFAVGDPWLYDEYTDGRKLPSEYENFAAMNDLSRWLLAQVKK